MNKLGGNIQNMKFENLRIGFSKNLAKELRKETRGKN